MRTWVSHTIETIAMRPLLHHHVDTDPAGDVEAPEEFRMFFLGPEGEFIDHDVPPPHRTFAEVARAWRTALESEPGGDPWGRRFGPRLVQGTGRPTRAGYRDEIIVTAGARPESAVAVAVRSALFSPPIRRLSVDETSLASRRYELTWQARLTLRPWHQRRVRVRLYASPSLNVTVLALSPEKSRPCASRRFLRVGNAAMSDLRDRLDDLVARQRTPSLSSRRVTT